LCCQTNQVITGKVLPCIIFSKLELCILHKVEVEVEIAKAGVFSGFEDHNDAHFKLKLDETTATIEDYVVLPLKFCSLTDLPVTQS
jgi:hypothetical protein